MEKQVAIIGAGISGLLACKYCLSKGFHPIIFESQGVVGGVWSETIESTKLQTFREMYQFTDFPWPPNVTQDYPDHNQVMEYLQSYATHFDLIRHIKFNSKVVGISYEGPFSDADMQAWSLWGGTGQPFGGEGKWDVTVEDSQMCSTKIYRVDFVILCMGRFKDAPNIPEFPCEGPEVFHGKVIHSTELAAMGPESAVEFIKRKQVAVVGFQKTALDIAMYCSSANGVMKSGSKAAKQDRKGFKMRNTNKLGFHSPPRHHIFSSQKHNSGKYISSDSQASTPYN